MLILFVANGPTKGKVVELSDAVHLIGRQSEEVQLNDSRVSRRHAELIPGDEGWLIRDVGSSNGTAVNGKWLAGDSPVAIRAGDRIQVGRTLMIVGDGDSRVMPKPRRSSRSKSKSRSSRRDRPGAIPGDAVTAAADANVEIDDELAAMLAADEAPTPDVTPSPTSDAPSADKDDAAMPMSIDMDEDGRTETAPPARHDEPSPDEPAAISDAADDDRIELAVEDTQARDEAGESVADLVVDAPDDRAAVPDPLDAIELTHDAEDADDDEELLLATDDSLAGVMVDLEDQAEAVQFDPAEAKDTLSEPATRDGVDEADDQDLLVGELLDESAGDEDEPAEALLDASLVDEPDADDVDDRAMADVARALYPDEMKADPQATPPEEAAFDDDVLADEPAAAPQDRPAAEVASSAESPRSDAIRGSAESMADLLGGDPLAGTEPREDAAGEAALADDQPDLAADPPAPDDPADWVADVPAESPRQEAARAPVESVDDLIGDDELAPADAHETADESPTPTEDITSKVETDDLKPDDLKPDELKPQADPPTDRIDASFADLDAMFAALENESDPLTDDDNDDRQPAAPSPEATYEPARPDPTPSAQAQADEIDTALAIADMMDQPAPSYDPQQSDEGAAVPEAIAFEDVDIQTDWSLAESDTPIIPSQAVAGLADPIDPDGEVAAELQSDVDTSVQSDADFHMLGEAADSHDNPTYEMTHDLLVDGDSDAAEPDVPLDVAAVLGVESDGLALEDDSDADEVVQVIDADRLHDEPVSDELTEPPSEHGDADLQAKPELNTFADADDAAASDEDHDRPTDERLAGELGLLGAMADAPDTVDPATSESDRHVAAEVTVDEPAGFVGEWQAPRHDEPHTAANDVQHVAASEEASASFEPPVPRDDAADATFDSHDLAESPSLDEPTVDDIDDFVLAGQAAPLDAPVADGEEASIDDAGASFDAVLAEPGEPPTHDAADLPDALPSSAPPLVDEPMATPAPTTTDEEAPPPADEQPVRLKLEPLTAEGMPRPPSIAPTAVPSWDVEEARRNSRRLHPAWKVLIPILIAASTVVGVVEAGNRLDWWANLQQPDTLQNVQPPPPRNSLDRDLEAARSNRENVLGGAAESPQLGPDPTDPSVKTINSIRDIIHEEIQPDQGPATPEAVDPRD